MGGTFAFARHVLQQADPFAIAFLRFCLATSCLIPLALIKARRDGAIRVSREDWKKIFFLGFAIIFFNQTLYLLGQSLTSASHAGLIFSATPIFVYLLAIKHLGESWSYQKGIGVLAAVCGSALIVFENGLDFNVDFIVGDGIILVAVIAWAYYTVYGKPLVEKYGALRVTAYALGSGSVMYFPFGLYRTITADLTQIDSMGWVSIFYIGIVTSVIGYSIWYWMLKHMEAGKASVLTNVQPIVAGAMGYYFLGETISWMFALGGGIIVVGVTITQKAK